MATTIKKMILRSASSPLFGRVVARQADRAIYNRVVELEHDFPPTMARKRYEFLSALLGGVMRNIRKGYISAAALERLTDVFVDDTLLETNASKRLARERFAAAHSHGAPNFIVLSPTQACNLRCKGCYASSAPESSATLDFATVDRIVGETRDIYGSSFVVLSGGEPLMYRSGGKTIFDLFAKYPDMFFMFYTNGTLITAEVARRLLAAGNASPAISVEGYEQQTDGRRGKGVFGRIRQAMANLREAGVPFGISITATADNVETLLTDEFYDYYFELQGASYAWQFQFMPIGRGSATFHQVVAPADRVRLYRMWENQLRKGHAVADFWNSGVLTNGCIAYGGQRGYIYIDWNGNIMPCVFVPYYEHNIKELYAAGKDLGDAVESNLMRRGRAWQDAYMNGRNRPENMITPCSIRDHFNTFRDDILTSEARAENPEAEAILDDDEYSRQMAAYDSELAWLTKPIWEKEYLETKRAPRTKAAIKF